jgi:hypothetical protein
MTFFPTHMSLMTRPRLIKIILYLIIYILLWAGYAKFVVPVFGYSGFEWVPSKIKVLESSGLFVLLVLMLPSIAKRPSDFFLHMHFLLPVLPMLVLYAASDRSRAYMYFVVLSFVIVLFVRRIHLPKLKGNLIPRKIMMWGLLSISVTYIMGIILLGGLEYFNLNLLRVYEFRSIAAENLPAIAGYLSPMISNIFLPFALLLSVYRHKWTMAFLSLAGSIVMFGLTHHKVALFYPFFMLGIFFIARSHRNFINYLLVCNIVMIIISIAPFIINYPEMKDIPSWASFLSYFFFRRGYFVPPYLNFAYYDFFSMHPHTLWADSKLTFGVLDSPYSIDPSHLVGEYLFDNTMTGANTGWIGTGYMHLGFTGLLFYALLVGLSLGITDMIAKKRDFGVIVALFFTPMLALFLSSDLPTVLLTHGLLLAFILAIMCKLNVKSPARVYYIPERPLSHPG